MDMVLILGKRSGLLRYIGLYGSWQLEVTGCAQFCVDLKVRFGFTGSAALATPGAQA